MGVFAGLLVESENFAGAGVQAPARETSVESVRMIADEFNVKHGARFTLLPANGLVWSGPKLPLKRGGNRLRTYAEASSASPVVFTFFSASRTEMTDAS